MSKAMIVTVAVITAIPKKDRIVTANILEIPGLQVVVGTEVKPNAVMAYFPENTQLSEDFCMANDLFEREENGKRAGGYIDRKHRRVKIQRFAGVKSEGLLVPLSHFDYLKFRCPTEEWSKLNVPGYEFDHIGEHRICKKYKVRHSNTPAKKKTRWEKIKQWWKDKKSAKNYYDTSKEFARHPDTEQLRNYIRTIRVGAELIVTEKVHGQSARTDKLRELSWWQKAIEFLNPLPIYEVFDNYKLMIGTRETVLNHKGFYKAEFRKRIAEKFVNCDNGECFSYEIAGFDDKGKPLMSVQHLSKLGKNYTIPLMFDDDMVYSYGCVSKNDTQVYAPHFAEQKEFVYRLDKLENGVRRTHTWDYTVNRCAELGLNTVPELDRFIHENVEETLARLNVWLANDTLKSSPIDRRHLIEGVCVRVEEKDNMGFVKEGWKVFKHKSFIFGLLEGYNKEIATEEEEN